MSKEKAQHWLHRIGAIVGLAAAFFTLNALAFDSEVDTKLKTAAQIAGQQTAVILHQLALVSQRQLVEGLGAQVRHEEVLQTWTAAELRKEADAGRLYELRRQLDQSQQRQVRLQERRRDAQERLDALEASTPRSPL